MLEGLTNTLGVPVVEHYGSSEAAQISANLPPPGPFKPGTCGIPAKGAVKIVDESGREVSPGEHGEILLGGPTLTSGYLDAPELNRASFVDGWFRTGDIGSFDRDGFLTIHGRKTEMINRGGEKISPAEVDDALQRHPDVAEAAAFAVPHPRLGEDVAAAVVLREGATATPLELREFLLPSLAQFKIPRRIVFLDRLPKGRHRESSASASRGGVQMTSESFVDAPDQLRSEILRICIRLLESPDLTIDDDFFDKGGDSLLATELMLELRQLTGKALPDSLLFESSTVRALAERLGEKEAPRPKPVVRVGAASDGATPLFFSTATGREADSTSSISPESWGREVSLIAVAPHGPGGEPIPASIEEMAADRLPEILAAQPTGPYRLAGHCVGGIVAFETARLLMKLNHRVELAMIDSPRVVGGQVLRTQGADGGGNAGARGDPAAAPDDIPVRPALPEFDWGFEAYESRLSAYSPTPLPVRLLVLASEYDGRDWVRLSGDGDLLELPGRHFDLVTTRINDLARSLSSWLAGNRPTGSSARPPVARADNGGTSSVGSGHREPGQIAPRQQRNRPPEIGGVKYDFLLRPLKRLFSQDRR